MALMTGWSKVSGTAKLLLVGMIIGIALSGLVALSVGGRSPDKEIIDITTADPEEGKLREQEVTIEYIDKKLQNIAELSTAEMIYSSLYTVTEGKIPFLTQKGFSMVYTATVRAGIDISGMAVAVDDKRVIVTLPKAEILMLKVDPESIQFYDEKHALFNWDKKTDVTSAIAIAESDTREKADTDGLLEQASQRAAYIVEGLLEGAVGDRAVVIKQQ